MVWGLGFRGYPVLEKLEMSTKIGICGFLGGPWLDAPIELFHFCHPTDN